MTLIATAEVIRHLIPVPFILLGLALARWPEGLARLYANVFGALGLERFRQAYDSRAGVWLVRVAGLAFAGIGAYWMVVGTG